VKNDDINLIDELLELMNQYKADFTNTFLALTFDKTYDLDLINSLVFKNWRKKWEKRIQSQNRSQEEIRTLMKRSNPSIIPRNHLIEEALENSTNGDHTLFMNLLEVLSNPYEHTEQQEKYQSLPENKDEP